MNVPLAVLTVLCGVYGALLESRPTMNPAWLFIGLHLGAAGAMLIASFSELKRMKSAWRRRFLVVLQLLVFRIAYFPVVVLSATAACYSEWLMLTGGLDGPVKIFPALFIANALLFAVIATVVCSAVNGGRLATLLLVAFGVPALMISFAGSDDCRLLPDNNWASIGPLPKVTYPQRNPYRAPRADQRSLNPSQQVIAFAGSVLYRLIPDAPWSQAAKGTLEQAFRNNPAGSSRDRLKDHYAAFLAAHNAVHGVSINAKPAWRYREAARTADVEKRRE